MEKRQEQIPDEGLLIKKNIYYTTFMISKSGETMLKSTNQKKKK
jgi:hypothetical protein